jgi:glycosyltransferase involved in cell wall biosynthesis
MKNTNNKKIALFIPSLRGGGAEKIFVNLANGFIEKNLKVDLVLAQKEGPYLKDLSEKINIINLNKKRILFSLLPLIKYLKKEKANILISALSHANIIALMANFLINNKVKIIVTEHNPISIKNNKLSFLKKILTKFFIKKLYKKAKGVVAVSQGVADDFVETLNISKNNLFTIYNPINILDIKEKSKQEIYHKWLNDNKHETIIAVGRLAIQKNFLLLIKAVEIVRKKIDIKLIILGEGEERNNLENLIKELNLQDSIDLVGFVDNPYAFLSKSNVFILSSIHEGLPTVLIEAMACGTPVVSTDCPSGPSEILEDGKYGKLVPVNDPEALAKAIIETLNNPIDSKKLQKRANFFSVENSVNKYLEIINN